MEEAHEFEEKAIILSQELSNKNQECINLKDDMDFINQQQKSLDSPNNSWGEKNLFGLSSRPLSPEPEIQIWKHNKFTSTEQIDEPG